MHKPFFDTLFVGRSIIELERTDSTNNFAAKLLNTQKPAEGTAIMTHIQEAGKGQRGNTWQSEAHKNLTVSFIFYPTFVSASKQFTLNIAISLGLHDYFKAEFGDRVKIKWPNDLYIDHKKVAGILIENIWSGSGLKSSIVGMGININQESFGEDLQKAASKKSFSGKEYPLKEELHAVSSFFVYQCFIPISRSGDLSERGPYISRKNPRHNGRWQTLYPQRRWNGRHV